LAIVVSALSAFLRALYENNVRCMPEQGQFS
jgi:hypothetical protein